MVIFFTALILSAVSLIRKGERPTHWDLLCGIGVGIPNYFSSRFLLSALKTVPAVVVFPVYSTATILIISATGILVFGEKLSRRKALALALILGALVLLNG